MARHFGRPAESVAAAAAAVVGLHSSDPATVVLSAAVRTRLDLDEIEAQMYSEEPPRLWRIHAMRRTLWMLTEKHARAAMLAVAPKVATAERTRLLGWVEAAGFTDDAERWLAHVADATVAAIVEDRGIGTRELSDAVPELDQTLVVGSGAWITETPAKSRVLYVLAMEGRIRRGPPAGSWLSSQYGWVPVEDPATGDAREASVRLVTDWLAAFGPATFDDIAWWFGWGVRATRAALADIATATIGEDELLVLDGDDAVEAPAGAPSARLVPSLDPTVMGWKDRRWMLGEHGDKLFDNTGNAGPIVFIEGRAVGAWGQRPDGAVALDLLEPLGSDERDAVEAERRWLETWLDGTVVRPRFPSPASSAIMKSSER